MSNEPWVLGVCGTFHDSTAALMRGNKVVAALEEERITRLKHDGSPFPTNSILRLLKNTGLVWDDLSDVAFAWDYDLYGNGDDGLGRGDRFFADLHQRYASDKDIPVESVRHRDVYKRNAAR